MPSMTMTNRLCVALVGLIVGCRGDAAPTVSGAGSSSAPPAAACANVLRGAPATLVLEARCSPYTIAATDTFVVGDLTIEPGVELRVPPGVGVMVQKRLVAKGTAARPIHITSSGLWGSLQLLGGSASILEHVQIDDAGYGGLGIGVLVHDDALVEMREVHVDTTSKQANEELARLTAIQVQRAAPRSRIEGVWTHSYSTSLVFTDASSLPILGASRGVSLVEVVGGVLDTDYTLLNDPRYLFGRVEVRGTGGQRPTLSVQEGTTIEFHPFGSLVIRDARLVAHGTASRRIRFQPRGADTAADDDVGKLAWSGLFFVDDTAGSVLEHVRLVAAATATPRGSSIVVNTTSELTLDHVVFLDLSSRAKATPAITRDCRATVTIKTGIEVSSGRRLLEDTCER
jgi:hypothetical protein